MQPVVNDLIAREETGVHRTNRMLSAVSAIGPRFLTTAAVALHRLSLIRLKGNMSESNEQVLNGYRFRTHALELGGAGWRAVVTYKSPVHPVGKRPER